jgi:Myb/SANT-like DNA-binding domain
MIETRLNQDAKFQSPKEKKNKLWTHVASIIKKAAPETAKSISGDCCDKKWRNLIITYKKILANNSKTGRGRTTWAYFDQLNEALGNRANIRPPPGMLGGSMELLAPTTEAIPDEPVAVLTPVRPTPTADASSSGMEPSRLFSRGRKRVNDTNLILQELAARQEREKERSQENQTRWDEQQKLEKERTDAIKSLADAIKLLAEKT